MRKPKRPLAEQLRKQSPNNNEPDTRDKNTCAQMAAGSNPPDSDLEHIDVPSGGGTKSGGPAADMKIAWQEHGKTEQTVTAASTCAESTSPNEGNKDASSSGRLSQIHQSQSEAGPDNAPGDETGSSHPTRGSPPVPISPTSARPASEPVPERAVTSAAPVAAASSRPAADSTTMTPTSAATAVAEPLPSTSGGGSSNPVAERRHSQLTILPRTSQYERHALLQDRTGSGLSEIQNFLLEKEEGIQLKKPASGSASNAPTVRPKLEPRAPQIESHALLERTSMGMCELELYLLELHREAQVSVPTQHSIDTESPPQHRPSRLEPRVLQYEKNELLEQKEEGGLSAIARFLEQKEQEIDKGKCSAKFVCKNVNCSNCRTRTNTLEGDTSTFLEPKTYSKRVHFKQQSLEKDSETGEVEKASSRHRSKSLGDAMDNSKAKRRAWKLGSMKFAGHRPPGAKESEPESDNVAMSAGVKSSQPAPELRDANEGKTDMGKTPDVDKRGCIIS